MRSIIRLLGYVQRYRANIIANVICNVLMVFFTIASFPLFLPFISILFDQQELVTEARAMDSFDLESLEYQMNYYLSQIILEEGKSKALQYTCIFLVLIFFLKNVFRYLSLVFMAPVRNGVVRDIRQQLFEKTSSLPLVYFSETRKGDLMSRITADVQEIEWSILNVLESAIREPFMFIGALGFMIYISPSLTIFVFGLIVFTALVIGGIGRTLKKQSGEVQEKLGLLVSLVEENLSGLRIVKAFNAKDFQAAKFLKTNNEYRWLLTRLLWRRDLASPLSEFLGIMTVVILIAYGFNEVQAGTLTGATFLVFLYAFYSVIEPAKRLSKAVYNIQKGAAAVERVEHILDAEEPIQNNPTALPIATFSGSIDFQNVSFAYPNSEENALTEVNLAIPKGKVLALVGTSGGGKSTLIDLLPRFHDVTGGHILIDGKNIKDIKLDDLRGLMAVVSQEAILFNDTIYNNIVFGLEDVTEAQVMEAAKIANAHQFILATENGYATNIGDRGMKLSGGQRQRLTIARAILRNPPILILDEATSALDSESERLVQEALVNVMQNRTTVVVAHRLSTIQHADEIVLLKKGRIVERGTHFELLGQGGEYQKLVELQAI